MTETETVTEDVCCEPGDCKTGRLCIGAVLLAAGEGARLGGRAWAHVWHTHLCVYMHM